MLKLDASYVNGLSEADLAVALKAVGVPVRGFARRPEVAPRQLLVKTVVQAVPSRPELLEQLAELWALRHPALAQECLSVGEQLDDDFDGQGWLRELAERVGEEGALQAVLYSSCLGAGLVERLLTPELLEELTSAEGAAPVAEPVPVVADAAGAKALAEAEADLRRLGRKHKALETEVGRLEQRLKTTLAMLQELQAENQRLRDQLELFSGLADLPEPQERVRRLVGAVLKMMKEQARLREELAVARGH